MKRSHPTLILALAFAACVPAQFATTARPAFAQTPPPAQAPPASSPALEPDEALAIAPDNWWLLDSTADRVLGTSADRAYRELLGSRQPRRSVTVAIIDSGVDFEHEDLDDNLWVNEREIAGNGLDDDGNGYADDIHGWSFLGGPDGRDVHHDTYEVTRLYVGCRDSGQLATPACTAIANEFEQKRNEAVDILDQYRNLSAAFDRAGAILRAQLGTDSLTREAVAAISSPRLDLRQAQQLYLQLLAIGVTREALDDGIESLANQIEYGYNPDFDPRPLLGDDYTDPTQRVYGSNRVRGPAADHGTHVAGIVGAERGNGVGVDGIAPAVRLMILRAVPDGDERDKDVANAIRYAADNGAQVINLSFGKGHSPQKAVVDEAVRHAESRGVLIVHAAGNDAADIDQENNFPNRYFADGGEAQLWIEVGASSWQDPEMLPAPFSNYGRRRVDVFAPGVEILSTIPGNRYDRNDGTSMAAPVVSGLAALLMAYYPDLTAAQVRVIILETATRFPGQQVAVPGTQGGRRAFEELSVTGGIVNAYEAMRRAEAVSGGGR